MEKFMKIVLDAMGSDTHPQPELEAAVQAARLFEDEIILVGQEELLKSNLEALAGQGFGKGTVRIVHAPEVLEMTDKPAENARRKAQNSLAIGIDLVKAGEAEAFVTAGNTGGAMATALFHMGRIRGVKRPGLTGLFPVAGGKRAVLLDIGANAECKPEYLLQFAVLGSIYAEKVLGIQNPRIGLLSNGEEAGKGNQLVKDTYPLLAQSGLNFIGNVEGKEVFGGYADVVVTDGFTGNVVLKASEAVAKLITDILRKELTSSLRMKIGALMVKPAFKVIKEMLDPAEVGAAPLLGIDGLVFVGHGRSDGRALVSAIRVARQSVESGLLPAMRQAIQERMSSLGGVNAGGQE
jgi:glycerol-3-phosphate acyltransferase PlsX